MSRDLNKIMLIGRLGSDPEMRYTASGTPVTQFRIAVNRRARSAAGDQPREETDWFTVIGWNKLAEIMGQYLTKGARVFVEGRLQTRSWEGQDGQKRYATEIVANDMIMLDTRRTAEAGAPGESGGEMEDMSVEDLPF